MAMSCEGRDEDPRDTCCAPRSMVRYSRNGAKETKHSVFTAGIERMNDG